MQDKNRKSLFFIGLIFMAIAFISSIVVLYIKDSEKRSAKRYPCKLCGKELKLQAKEQEIIKLKKIMSNESKVFEKRLLEIQAKLQTKETELQNKKEEVNRLKEVLGNEQESSNKSLPKSKTNFQAKGRESKVKEQEITKAKNMLSRRSVEKRLLEIQAKELVPSAKQGNIDQQKENVSDIPLWITDGETGEAILMRGSLKGVKQGSVYNIYYGRKLLGEFKVNNPLAHISIGQIVNYKKRDFPENVDFFKAKFD